MNIGVILATGNIILNVGAAVGYTYAKDWKKALYWLAAACITTVVTYMKDKV